MSNPILPCTVGGAFFTMRAAVAETAERFPGARFGADSTGGAKTMIAAPVCAALERGDVELQLVAGARPDLVRVEDGAEQAMLRAWPACASTVRWRPVSGHGAGSRPMKPMTSTIPALPSGRDLPRPGCAALPDPGCPRSGG